MHNAHPGLAHHFDTYDQQRESASLGMWLFLITEVMFFGGMFLVYLVYRTKYPVAFAEGSNHLDVTLGAINTAVLIGSSLTVALAVRAAQLGARKKLVAFLLLTLLLGGAFLGIKAIEYGHKFEDNLFPNSSFQFEGTQPEQTRLFYAIYFCMTGFHALHMLIGAGIILWLLPHAWRGRFNADNHNYVEGFGLYWHFVDIVWIFLFPLLYLLGRNLGAH